MIALLKGVHIAALSLWCAGLIALPIILQVYGRREEVRTQAGFSEFRLLVHAAYTRVVTPAAVVAISAGTGLIFAAEVRETWLMAKLLAVVGMVLVHAWLGHLAVRAAEHRGSYRMPPALIALPASLLCMGAVLYLVLAKPDFQPMIDALPHDFRVPQGRSIPSDLVPI
ncbi:CopD family protein [Aquabacter spiritensis]|uniref:Protoporphyrinogen IX oxidase n=1 Tax=Aquabacter spiritensis TaxID=933073 RepID=A0A4R3M5K8_9HYPH|nr:CopD family protein [Aquabacter spiritensis]TCT08312.1 putative membrane protein [Aquabacter spiritensis]